MANRWKIAFRHVTIDHRGIFVSEFETSDWSRKKLHHFLDFYWLKSNEDWVFKRPKIHLLSKFQANRLPSHCQMNENDKADDLAKLGALMPRDKIPVKHKILKAKIKRHWSVRHL